MDYVSIGQVDGSSNGRLLRGSRQEHQRLVGVACVYVALNRKEGCLSRGAGLMSTLRGSGAR